MTKITVGFTEDHGMSAEQAEFPPEGIDYTFLKATRFGSTVFKSPIKGYMSQFDWDKCDIVESVISPVITQKPWIYSLAVFQEAVAFSFFGLPSPKQVRIPYMSRLIKKHNCKKLLFWSEAGKQTLHTYGGIKDQEILDKSIVVYPTIREVPDEAIQFNEGSINILFSGDFFRKGGVNVIDAFEKAQQHFPNINLRVCCDEKIDFNTENTALRDEYLGKIRNNPAIVFGRVPRQEMIHQILPQTDIYLLPTYQEAFGFAVLEAMAFGIPVISTNHMAIPEIIEQGQSGFMIDTSKFDMDELFKGYVVNDIPQDFRDLVTDGLYEKLCTLIESRELREKMGRAGVEIARTKFSFSTRNATMKAVYEEAVAG